MHTYAHVILLHLYTDTHVHTRTCNTSAPTLDTHAHIRTRYTSILTHRHTCTYTHKIVLSFRPAAGGEAKWFEGWEDSSRVPC